MPRGEGPARSGRRVRRPSDDPRGGVAELVRPGDPPGLPWTPLEGGSPPPPLARSGTRILDLALGAGGRAGRLAARGGRRAPGGRGRGAAGRGDWGLTASRSQQMEWKFGLSSGMGSVLNLSEPSKQLVCFLASHTVVVYDPMDNEQTLLQGHVNAITSMCPAEGKTRLITADAGEGAILIVWDLATCQPVETLSDIGSGFVSLDVSLDSQYLVTMSDIDDGSMEVYGKEQEIAVWSMLDLSAGPLVMATLPAGDKQHVVKFNPENYQILSNGKQRTFFWDLDLEARTLSYLSPPVSSKDFNQPVGTFTVSTFVPGTDRALTATDDGVVVVWDSVAVDGEKGGASSDKQASKMVKLHLTSIDFLTYSNGYVITGGADGYVRFYDNKLRLTAWFEDMGAGPITSVSFCDFLPASSTTSKKDLLIPDFMIGTTTGLIIALESQCFDSPHYEERRGKVVHEAIPRDIKSLAVNPVAPEFIVCCPEGLVQLWDFTEKVKIVEREFEKQEVLDIDYFSNGKASVVCFADGMVAIIDSDLQDIQTLKMTNPMVKVKMAPTNTMFALQDTTNIITIVQHGPSKVPDRWEVIGKYKSHTAPVTSLLYEEVDGTLFLTSVGSDSSVVKYNLSESSITNGIILSQASTCTRESTPTAASIVSSKMQSSSSGGDLIVIADSAYKFLMYNPASGKTISVVLGPTYGGPIQDMRAFTNEGGEKGFLLYTTGAKVAGIVAFPLDGDPMKTHGVVADAGEIVGMGLSYDGKRALLAGRGDGMVTLWGLRPEAFEGLESPTDRYASLVEGGVKGEFYSEIVDYFYYAQLKAQGENIAAPRKITGKISLSELPSLMRALGYYPSEDEISTMVDDIKETAALAGKEMPKEIPFEQFLSLFTNYRPALGLHHEQIEAAFEDLGSADGEGINRDELVELLKTRGEPMTTDELNQCLQALTGMTMEELPQSIDAKFFAEDVLGFTGAD